MSEERIDGRKLRYQHRRPELLEAATEYVLDHGVSDLSLRPVAQALGISHASLIRHFATKDALITEVVQKIRTDVQARIRAVDSSETGTGAEMLRAVWRRLCEPKERRQFRVLFELAAAHASGVGATDMAQALVTDWFDEVEQALIRYGWPPDTATQAATFVLAQMRGLQIDFVATGDRNRVDQAFEMMIDLLELTGWGAPVE
ncbi:TetR/AcrR family transcriptional regulator [Nocardia transvalensis]|uniref:TetR/AcrR family transcriptional regulator n=1 Tax=Nocardia transvalensis TaxID=37333 RepID=UPI002B4B6AA9|nr:TetR/AcrR family transcriptional regulator [Nocardia transvalensis]